MASDEVQSDRDAFLGITVAEHSRTPHVVPPFSPGLVLMWIPEGIAISNPRYILASREVRELVVEVI